MQDELTHGETELSQSANEFLSYLRQVRDYSPLTLRAYAHDLQQFEGWLQNQALPGAVERLGPEDFYQYSHYLADRYSPSTVRRKLDCLSSLFNHLCHLGTVEINPLATVPRPKRTEKIPAMPTVTECKQLLEACASVRERLILLLLLTTGMRKSELIGLNCENVSEDFSQVKVLGKGRKERILPLPAPTCALLQRYLDRDHPANGPLILNRVDKRLGSTSLQRLFRRVVERAGLRDRGFTIHCTRHAFATQMLRSGCDVATLQSLLGHETLQATSRYLHADPSAKADAVARWSCDLVAGKPGTACLSETNGAREVA